MNHAAHVIERLWIRPQPHPEGRPEERTNLELEAGAGVVGDHTHGGKRHVTLVFADDWAAACADLGRDVDPMERRGNVLLSGGGGAAWIGQTVQLGSVVIAVEKETAPCALMDTAAEGLKAALQPDCRAGVWGRVVQGGSLVPGQAAQVIPSPG